MRTCTCLYRFFAIQAFAVVLYYCIELVLIGVLLYNGEKFIDTDDDEFVTLNNIDTGLQEQTQLFGKIVFLSINANILAFLYFPASFNPLSKKHKKQSVYVITEVELKEGKKM